MKKIAVTVAVLALGLAACAKSEDANNMAGNETAVENEAAVDMNAAMNAENAAGNALDAASNAIENAGEAVENAGESVANAADNAQ